MSIAKQAALLLLAIIVGTPAGADTVSDLRAALQRLPGKQPLHASFDVERSRHAKGRFLTDDFTGSAAVDCDVDAGIFRMSFSRATLDRASEERRLQSLSPGRSAGTDSVLQEIVPQATERAINFARSLSRLIERGVVVEQRNAAYQGKPARLVVMNLPPQKAGPGSDVGGVSFSADRLSVWAGADGTPLGAYRERTGKIGIFLVHADTVRKETWTFVVRGDHLCIASLDDRSLVSGIGQNGDALTTWRLRP